MSERAEDGLEIVADDAGLTARGEIDLDSADRLTAAVVQTPGRVVLSLEDVTFIDSSGLRVLIQHHQRFESAGGRLQLVNVSSRAGRLLEMAGLSDHLHVS